MAVKIQYHFKGDPEDQRHTCIVTHKQYENFRILPTVDHCTILEVNMKSSEESSQKLEDAIMIAIQRDRDGRHVS